MSLKRFFVQTAAAPEPKTLRQLERRVKAMATHDLPVWAERCIYAVGYNLTEYAKDPSRLDYLDEAVDESQALFRLVTEMRARHIN